VHVVATAGHVERRLPGHVALPPDAPDQAARILAGLPQPFTAAQARQ
jgi:selenocysteine-specific elongation factor